MERDLRVYLDLDGEPVLVGRLWAHVRGAKESASFEYAPAWLSRPGSFALDPELPLYRGAFHTERPLFNAFTDPAPDRWGQTLMRRFERRTARREGRAPRTLSSIHFLTGVDDETRLGALRFAEAGPPAFLRPMSGRRVPPVLDLPRLLSATNRVLAEEETDDDLQLLLAPGTSLGGARPKASVRDNNGELAIAKFPRKDDDWPTTQWEAATLSLAVDAGIDVPSTRLHRVLGAPVLLLRRFDRQGAKRIPYMSAMTALAATDGDGDRSYLEIAEFLRREGSRPTVDLHQLWTRIVFNILVSNTDDHLRNHAFLRDGGGWQLSPAYDLNPVPTDVRPRVHALAIDASDTSASLATALEVSRYFHLKVGEARAIARRVGRAVSGWPAAAAKVGLSPAQTERMASAFEHQDLAAASAM